MNDETIQAVRAAWRRSPEDAAMALLRATPEEIFIHAIRGCNQHVHAKGCQNKGTTREAKIKNQTILFKVDPDATEHKQIAQLMDVLEKSEEDGARYEAVIHRPEFGDLILLCGNPGMSEEKLKRAKAAAKAAGLDPEKVSSRGSGVKHALEQRHHLAVKDMAEILIKGNVRQAGSRIEVDYEGKRVVLEKKIKKGAERISQTKAKIISMRYI